MSSAIFKYDLAESGHGYQKIMTERPLTFISAVTQKNKPVVYALYDTLGRHTTYEYTLFTAKTGKPLPEVPTRFLGTCMLDDGAYVLHVFLVL